jgi:phosphotriesterase-related protein
MRGTVQTVLGPVPPEKLGPTMIHEHLLIDFTCTFIPPTGADEEVRAHESITLENIGWVRYNPYKNKDNLILLEEETAIEEASLYKQVGGGTIVDVTTLGIGRDPLGLSRIAQATGLNIVTGAGYYIDAVHPENMDDLEESSIAEQIANEIRVGVDGTDVKAGLIGEIGCSWPLTPNERKVLRASAAAQRETGAAILIHPGRDATAPREILEILGDAGADIGRTIMAHLDRTIADLDTLLDLARSGCYLEYDLFGSECSYYSLADFFDMPNDAQRMDFLERRHKHSLVKYGGHGYGHILENIAPRMEKRGFSEESIRSILVENPARALTIV